MEQDNSSYQEIWSRALKLLSRREHTELELRNKLPRGEEEAGAVLEVIENLKREDYLSDERFAEVYVRSRMERGDGPVKIRHALKNRGVSGALIERYLDPADGVWETILGEVWARKFDSAPANYKEWAKQARFLQSRGFTTEQIKKVVSNKESA